MVNAVGGVVSSNAVLTVNPRAEVRFESVTPLPDGRVRLEISGEAGEPLWIEQAGQLPNWLPLTNVTMTNSTVVVTDESATQQGTKLYRARQ